MTLFTKNLYTPHFSLNACLTDLRNFAGSVLAAVAFSAPFVVPAVADTPVLAPRESLASGALVPASPALEMASLALTPSSHVASATAASEAVTRATTSSSSDASTTLPLFLRLPKDASLTLFSYLTQQELMNIDSATTNKTLRPKVLELFIEVALPVTILNRNTKNAVLATLAAKFRRMTALDIYPCAEGLNTGFVTLMQTCSQLRVLNLSGTRLTADAYKAIAAYGKNLEELTFWEAKDSDLIAILKACSKLKNLALGGTHLTEDACIAIAQRCTKLESLNLSNYYTSDSDLIALIKACPELKNLNLTDSQLPEAVFIAIAQLCTKLESLNLSFTNAGNVSDSALIAILKACPELKNLVISGYGRLTADACKAIATHGKNLESLNLSRCDVDHSGFIAILKACSKLKNLDFSNPTALALSYTDFHVFTENTLQLQSLHLEDHSFINDADINAIAKACPHLTELNLSHCINLTDAAVIALATHCPHLNHLNADYTEITHDDIREIKKNHPNIKFRISCESISDFDYGPFFQL